MNAHPMKTSTLAFLACLSLGLVSGVSSADQTPLPDLGMNEHGFSFMISTPANPDGTIVHMMPNTQYNPLLIPCDVTWLSGGAEGIAYKSDAGPTVHSLLWESFWTAAGSPLPLRGYSGAALPSQFGVWLVNLQQPHDSIGVGWYMIDTIDNLRDGMPQPSDLPADQVVRMNVTVTGYTDDSHTTAYGDANPADNTADFWFKRECSCQ